MPPSEHNGPERFKATISASVKEVETRLSLRRAELDNAWADLGKCWPGVEQRMSAMGIVKKAPVDEPTVELNVRGSLVNFRRPLVEAQREGGLRTLASLFDSVWDERLPRDADGRIVLDESPVCVKHLLHTVLEGSESAANASQAMNDAFPADERPHLPYVSHTLGLAPPPGTATGMLVKGGSTILGPDEIAPLTAQIQKWCPDDPQELKLLFRASRDGWKNSAFQAKCGEAAPTVSLFRVMTQATGRSHSVIGGYSRVGFVPPPPPEGGESPASGKASSPTPFVFMLKDGSAAADESGGSHPAKWGCRHCTQLVGPKYNLNYGPAALRVASWSNATITTRSNPFGIPDGSSFLSLNDRRATEIEVFEVGAEAAAVPPPAKRSRRSSSSSRGNRVRLLDDTSIDAPSAMSAQEASDDLHNFGALIASPLMEEQTALFHAHTELVQVSNRASASAKALAAMYGPDVAAGKRDEVVELSVRGIRMTTLRSTLQACAESALAARFDPEKWAPTDKDLDEHGRQVIDCRPSCFSKVLDVLQMRKRAAWAGGDWKQGWGEATRVGIKAVDRSEFELFVHLHFPGCKGFVMDCVEAREESMA